MDANSVVSVDTKGLSKPLAKLVDLVGEIYRPWGMVREARAAKECMIIEAETREEIIDVAKRAAHRVQAREVLRQSNIEYVIETSKQSLPETVSEEAVEPDWVASFFEHCQDVSDKELAGIWARILSGEVANPGTYPKRTLNLLKNLSKQEADSFTRVCAYTFNIPHKAFPVVLDEKHMAIGDINHADIYRLEEAGLITREGMGLSLNFTNWTDLPVIYFGEMNIIRLGPSGKLGIGILKFTEAGLPLASIAGAVANPKIKEATLKVFRESAGSER